MKRCGVWALLPVIARCSPGARQVLAQVLALVLAQVLAHAGPAIPRQSRLSTILFPYFKITKIFCSRTPPHRNLPKYLQFTALWWASTRASTCASTWRASGEHQALLWGLAFQSLLAYSRHIRSSAPRLRISREPPFFRRRKTQSGSSLCESSCAMLGAAIFPEFLRDF